MKTKLLNSNPKTYALVLAPGGEVMEQVKQFAPVLKRTPRRRRSAAA